MTAAILEEYEEATVWTVSLPKGSTRKSMLSGRPGVTPEVLGAMIQIVLDTNILYLSPASVRIAHLSRSF
jgi:hypothetical protein